MGEKSRGGQKVPQVGGGRVPVLDNWGGGQL